MRDGAPVVYQAALVDGRLARARGLPRAAAGRRLRGRRHEARAAREAGARPPALLLHRAARADPGRAGPSAMHVVNGLGERETFRPGRLPRLLPAAARRASSTRSRTAGRPTRTRSTTARSATSSRSARSSGSDDDHLSLVAGIRRTQVERLTAAGITTLEALGDDDRTRRSRSSAPRRSRSSATRPRSSSTAAGPASSSTSAPPARARARLRAPARAERRATSGSTSRATPGTSRRAGSSTSSAGSTSTTTASRATTASGRSTATQEKAGFERLIDLIGERRAPLPGHARLPLRALRADGARSG